GQMIFGAMFATWFGVHLQLPAGIHLLLVLIMGMPGPPSPAPYAALFRGAIFNYDASTVSGMFNPLAETLTVATPLIIISLGIAISFRSGLFNIGGQGQMIFGAMFATWFGVHLQLPAGIHLLLVLIMG
ncbi:ABC transporter permease, partial [Corynebacterium diphtheriae]